MNGSPASPLPWSLAVFSIEALLRSTLPLPAPLRRRLSVPPQQLSEALRQLSPEVRAALLQCIEEYARGEALPGPLTLAELRAFLLGDARNPPRG